MLRYLVVILKTSTSVQTTLPMTATREAASTQLEATAVTAIQATREVYAKRVRSIAQTDKYLADELEPLQL